jgi:serine phosphatase RsbU (regulator of sigma subunit)
MDGRSEWSQRYDFWKSMSARSHGLFLAGVFCMFLPAGVLTDIPHLGANGPIRLVGNALFSGGIAVLYVLALRRSPRWVLLPIGVHLALASQFDRIFGPLGPALTGGALQARLATDVNVSTTAIVMAFVLLSNLIRGEGTRYGRVHAEIALARDIHRLLVPAIDQRVGAFQFHGLSVASGDVGGDLIDLVESPQGWTAFVADVSGHGVAAGLLMGMAKSTARTELRHGESLGTLLTTMNAVLFDLKGPSMFVTFAGLQFDGAALRFTLAGHLPILHFHAATATIDELSIAQLPLAMFQDQTFASEPVTCGPGDVLVILTDGLTEVFDRADRELGLDGVKALVREHAIEPLAVLADRLMAAVRAHGPQLDDQTLLLIRPTGRSV